MTHINAYEQDVEDAKQKVYAAQSELEVAQRRLADQRREQGLEEPSEEVAEEPEPEEPKKTFIKHKVTNRN